MSRMGPFCMISFLYGLRLCMFFAIHPVSALLSSDCMRCLWYCAAMYVVMSLSTVFPLCVNP